MVLINLIQRYQFQLLNIQLIIYYRILYLLSIKSDHQDFTVQQIFTMYVEYERHYKKEEQQKAYEQYQSAVITYHYSDEIPWKQNQDGLYYYNQKNNWFHRYREAIRLFWCSFLLFYNPQNSSKVKIISDFMIFVRSKIRGKYEHYKDQNSIFSRFIDQLSAQFIQQNNYIVQEVQRISSRHVTRDRQYKLHCYLNQLSRKLQLLRSSPRRSQMNLSILMLTELLKNFAQKLSCGPDLKFKLAFFGSLVNGFATQDSDIDVTILTNSYVDEKVLLQQIYQFLNQQLSKLPNLKYKIELVSKAAIPLIKVVLLNSKKPIQFNILINNVLGVLNSKLLSVYSAIGWIRQIGVLLKCWAVKRGLISRNSLSSYSFILIYLNFLIKKELIQPVKFDKQRYFLYKRTKNNKIEQFKVFYKFNNRQRKQIINIQDVNYFLVISEFMKYYMKDGQYWSSQEDRIISIEKNVKKQVNPNYLFTIKDPFDKPHNPGRASIKEKPKFTRAIRQSIGLLGTQTREAMDELFINQLEIDKIL